MEKNKTELELFNRKGIKYTITDIPAIEGSEKFQVEYYLQKMIDDIERLREPKPLYSFQQYISHCKDR